MRKLVSNLFLVLAGLLWAFPLLAQGEGTGAKRPPVIHTRFGVDSIMLGDQFTMELDIDKDVAQEVMLPQFDGGQLIKNIEVLGIDGVDTINQTGRRVKLRVRYRLTSFEAGNYQVAGFPMVWTDGTPANAPGTEGAKQDTVKATDLMLLTVGTYDIDTTTQTILDIKRPLNTPLIFAEIKDIVLWGGITAVILAAIIYLIVRYVQRRQGRVRARPAIPPHILAIRSLEKLHSKKLWQNGKHKEYYSGLSDIVRTYIERRYGIGAMEMTSDQTLDAIIAVNEERLREKLKELLYLADLAKFAKMMPSAEANEQAYFDAYFYIEETKELIIDDEGIKPEDLKLEKVGKEDDDAE